MERKEETLKIKTPGYLYIRLYNKCVIYTPRVFVEAWAFKVTYSAPLSGDSPFQNIDFFYSRLKLIVWRAMEKNLLAAGNCTANELKAWISNVLFTHLGHFWPSLLQVRSLCVVSFVRLGFSGKLLFQNITNSTFPVVFNETFKLNYMKLPWRNPNQMCTLLIRKLKLKKKKYICIEIWSYV